MFRFLLPSKSREVLKLLEEYNSLANSLSAIKAVGQTEDVAISLIRSGETVLDDMIVVLETDVVQLSKRERLSVIGRIHESLHIPCSETLGVWLRAQYDYRNIKVDNEVLLTTSDLVRRLQSIYKLHTVRGTHSTREEAIIEKSLEYSCFGIKKTPFWTPLDTLLLNVTNDKTFSTNILSQISAYVKKRSYFIFQVDRYDSILDYPSNVISSKNHTFLIQE